MNFLLRAPDGRLRPTLRVALFLSTFVLVASMLGIVAVVLLDPDLLGRPGPEGERITGPISPVVGLLSALAGALATWLFRRFVDHRPWVDLGLRAEPGWLAELGLGMGLGIALMGGIAALEIGLGGYRVDGVGSVGVALEGLLVGLLVFAAVAFGEELVIRGYVLQTLAEGWGVRAATVASALIFALLHAGNPGSGPVAILGIFCAGLMLAAAYLVTGRLWCPIGLHWTWNYFQGSVFGFAVSGTEANGLLRLSAVGPEWLTGGGFGPEASVLGVAASIVGTAALLAWQSNTRSPLAEG
ncbi:MAG: CPBP family intramembrane metalloprotease [Chloroflexi bacterium]|nr:CPBP family intramembrane metalloprotease [Chloroflexota bacterium]